jgi:epoxyqueuosine reductase
VALGNRGRLGAVPALAGALAGDPEPLVRLHAAWALGALTRAAGEEAVAEVVALRLALEHAAASDGDSEVRAEARAALERGVPG